MKVGSRIAVLAEPGDDIASLEIPAEEIQALEEETKSNSTSSKAEEPPSGKTDKPKSRPTTDAKNIPAKAQKQTYPLYPSVSQLLQENGLEKTQADKIPATGPNGRLLKGDVLSYLGTIEATYSAEQSKRISKLGHLDLSNIKVAPPKSVESPQSEQVLPPSEPDADTEIAVTISFKAIGEVQRRVHTSLGIDVPLETFIARAVEISNTDLPRSAMAAPTADELFNQVLGLDTVDSTITRGHFLPQIVALPATTLPPTTASLRQPDIIDVLSTNGSKNLAPLKRAASVTMPATNVFSVTVPKGDERRARIFLERVKTILQIDPGRLVL